MSTPKRIGSEYESAPVAALVVAQDGTVSTANPTAHRMLGYPAGSLRGLRLDAILPEDWDRIARVFEARAAVRLEGRARKADGRALHVGLTIEPTSKEPGPVGHVALLCRPLPPWASVPKQPNP